MVSLRRKAMKLWTEKVKDVQGRVCAVCGLANGSSNNKLNKKTGKMGISYLNAHHIEDRSNYALRWDLLNGIALCPSCHEFGKNSAHRAPVWFVDWISDNRPKVLKHIRQFRASRPQTADGYSRNDLMTIIANLSMSVTAEELDILSLNKPVM